MMRVSRRTTACVFALCSGVWLGAGAPVQAATITETFELKVTFKEWCEGNPKFFENLNVKVTDGTTLTFKRDAGNTDDPTDVAAKINNSGSADIDAITMNGLAFSSNKAGSKLEFALSGVNPGNDDHFFTIRGQATLDKLGNVTKLTGTFVEEGTGTYTLDKKLGGGQSSPVECFASGTFVTGKKL